MYLSSVSECENKAYTLMWKKEWSQMFGWGMSLKDVSKCGDKVNTCLKKLGLYYGDIS